MRGPLGGGTRYFGLIRRQGDDFRFIQGSDVWWELEFDGTEAENWTSYAARGHMRADFRDLAPEVLATISVIITQANPGLNKRVFCSVSNAQSDAVTANEGRYDIEIDNGTVVRRVISEVAWQTNFQVTDL